MSCGAFSQACVVEPPAEWFRAEWEGDRDNTFRSTLPRCASGQGPHMGASFLGSMTSLSRLQQRKLLQMSSQMTGLRGISYLSPGMRSVSCAGAVSHQRVAVMPHAQPLRCLQANPMRSPLGFPKSGTYRRPAAGLPCSIGVPCSRVGEESRPASAGIGPGARWGPACAHPHLTAPCPCPR